MMRLNKVLASLATAGLLLSQPAAAASAGRTATSIDESEGMFGSSAGPAIAAILMVLLIAALPLFDSDSPSSP